MNQTAPRNPRVHYHSDCEYFAGCERLLPILWHSEAMAQKYRMTFSYRSSRRYEMELKTFLPAHVKSKPIFVRIGYGEFGYSAMIASTGKLNTLRCVLEKITSILFLYPLFLYEVIKLSLFFLLDPPLILHINNGGYPGSRSARSAAIAGKICRLRTVLMTVNNIAVPATQLSRKIDAPIDRLVARSVDKFITSSKLAGESIKNVLELGVGKVITIDNVVKKTDGVMDRSISRKELGLKLDDIVIGIVANLETRKGHSIFLDALSLLVTKDASLLDRIKVLIIGEGPLGPSLQERSQTLGLQQIVRFLGYRYDYLNLVAGIDFMVLASTSYEDSPLCTIEAMSLGIPSVVSDFAGLSTQVINNYNGLLFHTGDKTALAHSMEILIYNKEIREIMGRAAISQYQNYYTPEIFIKRHMVLYDSLTTG